MNPLRLTDFLDTHREAILVRWEAEVAELPENERLSHAQLRDDIPRLLDELAEGERGATRASRSHALERHAQGVSLAVVAEEYARLRECILTELECSEILLDARDTIALHRAIDHALKVAVELHARVRQRTLEALDEVSTRVAAERGEPDQLLTAMVDVLAEATGAPEIGVFVCEPGGLRLRAASGASSARIGELWPRPTAPRELTSALLDPSSVQRAAAIELAVGGRKVGVVVVAPQEASSFSDQDRQLMRIVADRVGTLFVHAQLELHERVWNGATHVLTTADSIPTALDRLAQMLTRTLRWEASFVWSEANGALEVRQAGFADDALDATVREQRPDPEHSLAGRAWRAGSVLSTQDPGRELGESRGRLARRHGVTAAVAMPLIVGGRCIAVLEMWTRRRRSADDLLQWLVEPLSLELERLAARLRAEDESRRSRAELDAMLATAVDAVIWIDGRGVVVEWNEAAEALLGYRREQAIGRELAAFVVPEPLRQAHRAGVLRQAQRAGTPSLQRRLELSACRADGSQIPVEVTLTRANVDRPLFIGYVRDRRREALDERLAAAREAVGRALADTLTEAQVVARLAEVLVPSFAHGCLITTPSGAVEASALPPTALDPDLDASAEALALEPAMAALEHVAGDGRLALYDHLDTEAGSTRGRELGDGVAAAWRALGARAMLLVPIACDKPPGYVVVLGFRASSLSPLTVDTARGLARLVEQALWRARLFAELEQAVVARRAAFDAEREARSWLQAVLDSAPLVVFIKDREGCYEYVNQSWVAHTGIAADTAIGRCDGELFPDQPEEVLEAWRRHDDEVLTRMADVEHEEVAVIDGEPRTFLALRFPLRDASGRVSVCGMARDITDARTLERAREEFVAILGHDLRNPLQAIGMATTLLERIGGFDARQQRLVGQIASSVERMRRLVADVMDFAQGRLGGGIPVEPGPCDLAAVCDAVRAEVAVAHPERDIVVDSVGDACGQWDEARLEQVVANLVTNAIRHGSQGSQVHVRIDGAHDDQVSLLVNNATDCPPVQDIATLFEPFRRSTGGAADAGLGLGLYIVGEIARAHRATISATCDERDGFTVRLCLPRTAESRLAR